MNKWRKITFIKNLSSSVGLSKLKPVCSLPVTPIPTLKTEKQFSEVIVYQALKKRNKTYCKKNINEKNSHLSKKEFNTSCNGNYVNYESVANVN